MFNPLARRYPESFGFPFDASSSFFCSQQLPCCTTLESKPRKIKVHILQKFLSRTRSTMWSTLSPPGQNATHGIPDLLITPDGIVHQESLQPLSQFPHVAFIGEGCHFQRHQHVRLGFQSSCYSTETLKLLLLDLVF